MTFRDISINVTCDCNLRCSYCFYPRKEKEAMTKLTARWVKGWIDRNVKTGSVITFFGIEPMRNWKIIRYLIRELGDQYQYDITTNATLINESRAKDIAKWKMGVLVSWDGLPGCHDPYRSNSYDWTVRGIKWLNKFDVVPAVATTVLPETIWYMKENFIHMMETVDIQYVHFNMVKGWETSWIWSIVEQEFDRLYRYVINNPKPEGFMAKWLEHRKKGTRLERRCSAGIGTVGIDYNGDIWPCHRTTHWKTPIGDVWRGINQEGIQELVCNICEMCTVKFCHVCWIEGIDKDSCRMMHIRETVLERIWNELNGS